MATVRREHQLSTATLGNTKRKATSGRHRFVRCVVPCFPEQRRTNCPMVPFCEVRTHARDRTLWPAGPWDACPNSSGQSFACFPASCTDEVQVSVLIATQKLCKAQKRRLGLWVTQPASLRASTDSVAFDPWTNFSLNRANSFHAAQAPP
jgi:hypothetical protein